MQLLILQGFQFEGDDYVAGHAVDVEPVKALRILHNFRDYVSLVQDAVEELMPAETVPDQEWPAGHLRQPKTAPMKRERTRKVR